MISARPARHRPRASERAYLLHGLESGRPLRVRAVLPASTPPAAGPDGWAASVTRLARHLRNVWQRMRASWARRRIERTTRVELHALDARALRDLGLDRSQIPSVAAATATGDARSGWSSSAPERLEPGLRLLGRELARQRVAPPAV